MRSGKSWGCNDMLYGLGILKAIMKGLTTRPKGDYLVEEKKVAWYLKKKAEEDDAAFKKRTGHEAVPSIDNLFSALLSFAGPAVFNQYAEVDKKYDVQGADGIRCSNLLAYLEIFQDAKYVLVGEAPSFHGCRFSGIPFMSEELLIGERRLDWAGKGLFRKTSKRKSPMSEHSASIVWETLGRRRDVILWNAFPWHTFKSENRASNRRPTKNELGQAAIALKIFLGLFPKSTVFAVGRTAEKALKEIGVEAKYIRHPAMGGKRAFMAGIARLSQT